MADRLQALLVVALTALLACTERELAPTTTCLASRSTKVLKFPVVDKTDVLFVVDDSASMADEQAHLREQFPNMIRALTTGKRSAKDPDPFPPLKDLHVGVVSSDLGLPGLELASASCHADGGDDGRLQHAARGADCQASYPDFLWYVGSESVGPISDLAQFGRDTLCISDLGTGGCGYEQLLESPFKALWPKLQRDARGEPVMPNEYRFLATSEPGTWGKGDLPAAEGGNLGFLRNSRYDGLSTIMIVVVTDEDDCSLQSTEGISSDGSADPDCQAHKDRLYDLQRYHAGFRKLRPGAEELVIFGAIAGVPEDLVDAKALSRVDFSANDPSTRNAYYDRILSDPRMQEVADPAGGKLEPSCGSSAYPPRRLVELARRFDRNGMVQSICQDDFVPVLTPLLNVIANQLTEVCLPRKLVRGSDGKVPCHVYWELPPTSDDSLAPTECDQRSFLRPVGAEHAKTNARGGNNCELPQLAVLDRDTREPPSGDGWYYDDFSLALNEACKVAAYKQRIALTSGTRPPRGVTVTLECYQETQRYPNTRLDLNQAAVQPEIGTSCDAEIGTSKPAGDAACIITLADNSPLTDMFCHEGWGTCVRSCSEDADCPPGWGCDAQPEHVASGGDKGAYCINLACGPAQEP